MCANPQDAFPHAERLCRLKKWRVLEAAIAGLIMVLDVRRTRVTETGINELRKLLPNCMILTEPQPELPGR